MAERDRQEREQLNRYYTTRIFNDFAGHLFCVTRFVRQLSGSIFILTYGVKTQYPTESYWAVIDDDTLFDCRFDRLFSYLFIFS